MPRVAFISLGCAKNTVDTETAAAELLGDGFDLAPDPEDADLVLVNTCAFIAPARRESEAVLDDLFQVRSANRNSRQRIVAIGCYAERYAAALRTRFPELAAVWGLEIYGRLAEQCRALLATRPPPRRQPREDRRRRTDPPDAQPPAAAPDRPDRTTVYEGPRLLTTPASYAWLRLSDGCDNRCAYCAIPDIRGAYRERPADAVVAEAETLARGGAKELVLIAQDTTRYDAAGAGLAGLLRRLLEATPASTRLRLLYAHPAQLDREVMTLLAEEPRLCRYLDLPFQHASDPMLKAMHRGYDGKRIEEVLDFFAAVPDFTLRTTLLAGFPGETPDDFAALTRLASDPRIQWLGAFAYSHEDGTPAATFAGTVPEAEAARRRDALLAARQAVTFAWLDRRAAAGAKTPETVLLDTPDPDDPAGWLGRTHREAPDGDGLVRVGFRNRAAASRQAPGDTVKVRLVRRDGYDLVGKKA